MYDLFVVSFSYLSFLSINSLFPLGKFLLRWVSSFEAVVSVTGYVSSDSQTGKCSPIQGEHSAL